MFAWSTVTICMTAMKSGWSFILCRFLVGLTEGPFIPAVSLMTSSWYTKEESPLRMAIWHAGNVISNVISGLLAAAILTNMQHIGGLSAWQVRTTNISPLDASCRLTLAVVVRIDRRHHQHHRGRVRFLAHTEVAIEHRHLLLNC